MKTVSLKLDKQTIARLKRLTEINGANVSESIRVAVGDYLSRIEAMYDRQAKEAAARKELAQIDGGVAVFIRADELATWEQFLRKSNTR
jgi:hypothetical protein